MVPEGAAADLIRKTKAGIVVDPKDIVGIENAIRKIYEEYYIKRKRLESNEDEIKKYDRELLAGKLERVLIGAMEEHGKS